MTSDIVVAIPLQESCMVSLIASITAFLPDRPAPKRSEMAGAWQHPLLDAKIVFGGSFMRCLAEMSAATGLTRSKSGEGSYSFYCRTWRLLGSLA
jgi:hypothetical protein